MKIYGKEGLNSDISSKRKAALIKPVPILWGSNQQIIFMSEEERTTLNAF